MSFVYQHAAKKSLENALAKAWKIKPVARVVGFGEFLVAGSKGEKYPVKFGWNERKELVCSCGCMAGRERGIPCYHVVAVSGLFKGQVAERRAARAAALAQAQQEAAQALEALGGMPAEIGPVESADRFCPACGFCNPDDDSETCQACGADLNPTPAPACDCGQQHCSKCNPVYCAICGHSHKDGIAACPGCGYRYY